MTTNNEEREVTIPEILAGIIAYKNRVLNFKFLKDGIERKYVGDELDLEDRQQESVLKLVEDTEDSKYKDKGYFHACTAFGKTYLMMAIAEGYRYKVKDKKIVIFEENSTVLEQVKKDFIEKTSFSEEDIGAYYGKEKTPESPIIVCTYASMKKLIAEVGRKNIGLALCDEAHHILSENRQEVAKYLDHSCLYGFTATPIFNEEKACEQVFGEAIDIVTLKQGIKNGLLCGFKNGLIVSKIPLDLSEAKNNSGDYDPKKLSEIIKQSHLHGMREELADFYLHGQDDVLGPIYGKTTLINAFNQEEANFLAEAFNQKAGKTIAKAYHTNSGEEPLEEFNKGEIPVLIQVNRLTEGYSNPNIEVCINYPTSSVVKSAQRSGRALRRNKHNPNKIALILDIAFKKNNDLDTLSAIKANNQVLFSDIAQDFIMYPEAMKDTINFGSKDKEKIEINSSELFEIITDYENLFELGFDSAVHTESTTPKREISDTDITKTCFNDNAIVKDETGKSVGQEIKPEIYDEVLKQRPDLFIRVQSGPRTMYVVPREKRDEFREYLQDTSFDIKGKIINIKNITFHDEKRELKDTDITTTHFQHNAIVKDETGKSVGQKIKPIIYEQVSEQRKDLFIKVQSGPNTIYTVPIEKRKKFREYLQKTTFEIDGKIIKIGDITFHDEKKELKDTDITKTCFKDNAIVKDETGKSVEQDIKAEIYDKVLEQRPDLFIKVQSGPKTIYAVPREKRKKFREYLQKTTFKIDGKIIKIGDITFHDEKKELKDTDITATRFRENAIVKDETGKSVGQDIKPIIYDKVLEQRKDLFIKVQSGPKTIYAVPREKRKKFREYLQKTTFKIDGKIIKIGDITFHDEKKKKTKTTSNQIMPNNGGNDGM